MLSKKKEQSRKLFKETNNQQHYKKFSLRKKLKNIVKEKMRSNFNDDLAPNTITKNFGHLLGLPQNPLEYQKKCFWMV